MEIEIKGFEIKGCVIEIGDTVRLKSGGPPMTVYNISETSIDCRWWDHEFRKYNDFGFCNPAMLVKISESLQRQIDIQSLKKQGDF